MDTTTKDGGDKCWDFPDMVVHATGGTCPRYNGGVCHPLPMPTPPYTEEEAEVVAHYYAAHNDVLLSALTGVPVGSMKGFVQVTGKTGSTRKKKAT